MVLSKPLPDRFGLIAALLALICPFAIALAGCQAQPQQDEAREAVEAHPSSKIEIIDDRAFWGDDETLWTADVESDGSLEDIEQIGEFNDRVRGLAAYDGTLYAYTVEGIYRMGLHEDADDAELIVDEGARDDLWVTSVGLFYLDDGVLGTATLSGSDETTLKSDVKDFAVAGDRIYLLNEDGSFTRTDLDGENEEELDAARDRHDDSVLIVDGDDVYLVSDDVLVCRGGASAVEEIGLSHEVETPDHTAIYDGAILYEGASDRCYRHVDGDGDDERVDRVGLWSIRYTRIQDGMLYFAITGESVTVVDLESLEEETYRADDDAKSASGKSDGTKSSTGSGSSSATTSSYDIGEDMEVYEGSDYGVVSTAHFTLLLDIVDMQQGLWYIEQVNDTTIKFCYTAGRASGFDGTVFTLRAYDWGDNAYEDIPNTRIAGTSADKKYVVIMPTDVRYDASDATQVEQYAHLRAYAESIDANANPIGNPFTVRSA